MNEDKPKLIKSLLKDAGVKQKHLARDLSVSPQFVNQVVLGQRSTSHVREAISIAIGKPVSELWPDQQSAAQEAA